MLSDSRTPVTQHPHLIGVTDRTPSQSLIVIRRLGVEIVSGWQLLTAGLSRCVPEDESVDRHDGQKSKVY